MQEKRRVARVEACVQNKLPQLALNFHNNSLCCSKQRKIQLTVGILSVERKNRGRGLFLSFSSQKNLLLKYAF